MPGDELLGRHVADGAAAGRIGGGNLGLVRGALEAVFGLVLWMQSPCQTKVENLHQPTVGQHHVLRFQIAMEDAERVRCIQAIGNLYADRKNQLERCRAACNQAVKRLTGHVLHGDKGFVLGLADFVDAADVGMVDGRCQPRLAQHGRAHLFHAEQAGAQDLQHHRAF